MKTNQNGSIDLIKYPIFTEKTIRLQEQNQYTFAVNINANKIEIKKAIEELFGADVILVNTIKLPLKKKRVGKFVGTKAKYKKAIVKFGPETSIDFFEAQSS